MASSPSHEFKLYETIFIETNLLSHDYDGVVLILYPKEKQISLPRHIGSYVDNILKVDKYIFSESTVWNCDYVSGGKLVLSPTGPITPYHGVKVIYTAAKNGIDRALKAGIRKPLMVVQNIPDFPESQMVAILGAFEALYVPVQMKNIFPDLSSKFERLGLHAEEGLTVAFERVVRNSIALERSRIFARDLAGADPEWMTPAKAVHFIQDEFSYYPNVKINVIESDDVIAKEYPLLAAVSRGSSSKHRAKIVELIYRPSDLTRVVETLILIGKGVTYDTGGVDIKTNGKMSSSSRDKSGAAAVAGFVKACSILKPPHLKVIGVLCLCRNSIGHNSYVCDELILSRSWKVVRITNTDAEGRLTMADSLFKWTTLASKELSPHIYTIATLTDHAISSFGHCTAAMDNHCARASKHSLRLQMSGNRIGEPIEVSTILIEDLEATAGKENSEDLLQDNITKLGRLHQIADVLNLFAKQQLLPEALRELKYDPDSVTHFDQRAFSKNGHRTLIFKDKSFVQRRVSLTETDIRKIKIIYASECVNRDRLEKIDTCRSHVDFNRRKKREINRRSLRVNPDITPPPEIELNTPNMEENSEYFDLEKQLEIIAKKLHDITNKSLESMKKLLCNGTKPIIGKETPKKLEMPKNIVLPIMEVIVNNLAATIINVTSKLDVFCAHEGSYDSFLIANCSSDGTCPVHGLSQRVKRHNPATEFEIDATVNIEKMQEFRRQKRRGVQKKRMGDEIFVNNTRKSEKGRLKDYKPILRLTKNNEEFYEDRRWPQGIVPFVIDKKLIDKYDIEDLRRRIEEVNRILKKKTCVKLIEIKEGDKKFRDYLVLNTNDDYVTGHVGGRQEFGALELFKGGQHRQHTAMMVMAMLGFYFEVSRHDRDEYIRVHDRHIRPDKLHHFEKIKEEATLKVPYDFESAMHPAWQFWRSVGRKGVSSVATYKNLDPAGDVMKKLGQHEKLLSDYDIIKINAVYNCNKRP